MTIAASSKPIIVQKYGGSSVADVEHLQAVAQLIKKRRDAGYRVCVVVSAMGGATDVLLAQAQAMHSAPPRRELDMLLSTGERASVALLAMALDKIGVVAISFTGSQSGIITNANHADARVVEVRPYRVEDELARDKVVLVAGFQGVSYLKEITTLGRGGSDTTAVALAAALNAEACEIYSDVDGIYSADPHVVDDAIRLEELSYPEMQELAAAGARVLNAQAVQFAKARRIALYARQTGSPNVGTVVRRDVATPTGGVRGVAHNERMFNLVAPYTHLEALLDHLDVHALPTGQLFAQQHAHGAGGVFVLLPLDDAYGAQACFAALPAGVTRGDDCGVVSLVGEGILEDRSVLRAALACLSQMECEVLGISTSSFRVSLLVEPKWVIEVTRALHALFLSNQKQTQAS